MHSIHDAYKTTRAGKAAFDARWARTVDPEGKLSEAERERKAEQLKRAYFVGLALKRHAMNKASREKRAA